MGDGGQLTKAALSNARKSGAGGPLLGVDHTPGQTRDFCMAEGKGKARPGSREAEPLTRGVTELPPHAGTTQHAGATRKAIKGEVSDTSLDTDAGGPWGT